MLSSTHFPHRPVPTKLVSPNSKSKLCSRKPLISVHCMKSGAYTTCAFPPNDPPICSAAAYQSIAEHKEEKLLNAGRSTGGGASVEDPLTCYGLRRELMPNHVGVIMDGNRRWAKLRGLPVLLGYEAGFRSLKILVELCCNWGIRVLTVFAFSSDNWSRPKVEVEFLMYLFEKVLREEMKSFMREKIRITMIGNLSKLPRSLRELITRVEGATRNNFRLQLIMAISYGGRQDIVQACQKIALKARDGVIEPNDVDESLIEKELETNCTEFPSPDLLIRTSGELRLSNFFLWQLSYTELFFSGSLWPDFGKDEFVEAINSYQQRKRRYGLK